MTVTEISLVAGVFACCFALALIAKRKRPLARPQMARNLSEQDIEVITRCVGLALGADEAARLDVINAKLDQMRHEFEWMMNETLTAQAVSIARSTANDTAQPAISGEELDAIRKYRRMRRH